MKTCPGCKGALRTEPDGKVAPSDRNELWPFRCPACGGSDNLRQGA